MRFDHDKKDGTGKRFWTRFTTSVLRYSFDHPLFPSSFLSRGDPKFPNFCPNLPFHLEFNVSNAPSPLLISVHEFHEPFERTRPWYKRYCSKTKGSGKDVEDAKVGRELSGKFLSGERMPFLRSIFTIDKVSPYPPLLPSSF